MDNTSASRPSDLIREARAGNRRTLSDLIDGYRSYLKLLARLQQDVRLRAKLDDSDWVQEVSMLAIRDFPTFQGETEAEFTNWLHTIMARVAAKSVRYHTSQRRNVQLEQDLQAAFDLSSHVLSSKLAARDGSPSEEAIRRERAVLVAGALDQLPDHYREVVILRDFEGLTPRQIAERMDRSADAVCKIWARAMVRVRRILEDMM